MTTPGSGWQKRMKPRRQPRWPRPVGCQKNTGAKADVCGVCLRLASTDWVFVGFVQWLEMV